MRISDWSSDVCSSDLGSLPCEVRGGLGRGVFRISANRGHPLPTSPCLRRGRSKTRTRRLKPVVEGPLLQERGCPDRARKRAPQRPCLHAGTLPPRQCFIPRLGARRMSLVGITSTARLKVRSSPGCMAPTPTTWCATSLPSSSRMVSTTEYSHAPPSDGWRILPSTLSGVMVFDGCASGESKRRQCLHDGQTLELSRIVVLQVGQVRVAPARSEERRLGKEGTG